MKPFDAKTFVNIGPGLFFNPHPGGDPVTIKLNTPCSTAFPFSVLNMGTFNTEW